MFFFNVLTDWPACSPGPPAGGSWRTAGSQQNQSNSSTSIISGGGNIKNSFCFFQEGFTSS